jgi:hypothetical protein
LEKADEALRTTISRAVTQGLLGLASGKDPKSFERVWFAEPVEDAEITFDFDTYLLSASRAKVLKTKPAPRSAGADLPLPTGPSSQPALFPPELGASGEKPTATKPTQVVWEGQLKREQWNLFSLKVLTRLAQAKDVRIDVRVSAELAEGQSAEQLNTALKELGIDDTFKRT